MKTSSVQPGTTKRRFDCTLAGDTALDVLIYGLPDELPPEQELFADGIAIRVGGSGAITAHNRTWKLSRLHHCRSGR